MATLEAIPEGTAKTIIENVDASFLLHLLKIKIAIDATDSEKASVVDDPTEDNILTVDSDGGLQDSGSSIEDIKFKAHDHTSATEGGDYAWADMAIAATQTDASAISAVALTAGADTVDITATNLTLATMRTEINAIVSAFNALVDKLQTAKQMT